MKRIGVFGASFNPPTVGHYDVIEQAAPFFDEILLVPSLSHPFLKQLESIENRLAMLTRFVDNISDQNIKKCVKIFNIEATLQKKLPPLSLIYTYDVLLETAHFYQTLSKPIQLRFIVGPDISQFDVWQKFYRYKDIEKNWPLFIAKENQPIHSTQVRNCVLKYEHDKDALLTALHPLVGEPIARYIIQHKLYQDRKGTL